ncbi:tRNA adenosine(34) deaminase TadA [Aquisalimonas sp. 2447]|uniref:tRNA adenosine(34) deaminase TadA n=1 Tax=Aquisalimonas sp. 2447 TaxID=2740807 RepID=UPI0014327815|nr:tRNA adenosine(34) deaminase TadA [Aquisalimonas sp. 2447]QIT55138.1 tRNA adenosine(34) deaminase TadA [Aquisalimonas sp. 2447]
MSSGVQAEDQHEQDRHWMEQALLEARRAEAAGEVPVGAVLVRDGGVLARGWNHPIGAADPTVHAEIHALRAASSRAGNYRLTGTTLYVTLEPCVMCVGALVHARVARLVFAASEPRTGAVESCFRLLEPGLHNHDVIWQGGVLAEESAELLRGFFRSRR